MSDAASPPEASLIRGRAMALAAIVVAVSAPFWFDRTLGIIGLHTPPTARLAATRFAIGEEERRLAALEAKIDAIAAKLADSRSEATQLKASTDALASWSSLYALTDLTAALRQSEPFGLQLSVARAVTTLPANIRKLLDQLVPYASVGVPDAARITHDFNDHAARLGWTGPRSAPVAMLNRVLTWSRDQLPGETSPADTTGPRLAEASTQLAAGDIAGAVETVEQLDSPARDGFADWLEDASARAAADRLTSMVGLVLSGGHPATAPAAAAGARQ